MDNNNTNQDTNNTNNTKNRNITIVVPYIKGTSEKLKRLCKSKGIQVDFKGTNALRTQLVNPKDKDPKLQKSGIIYQYKCPHLNCPEAYIGESGRALGDMVNEHLKASSPIFNHISSTGHLLDLDCFSIICKEIQSHSRTIKEAVFIRVNDPMLNRHLGKYQLLHIWDSILQATPTLQLKLFSLPLPTLFQPTRTPPLPSPHPPLPPCNHSLKVGAHVHLLISIKSRGITPCKTPPNTSPTQLNFFLTQQCHLGKLYHFICKSNISLRPDEAALA